MLMLTTNRTILHHVKNFLSDNWWEDFVLLCGITGEASQCKGELVSTRNTLIEFRGVRFSSEWYGLVGPWAQESLPLTQRTQLVSKVIFSAPNISTDPGLHTKQAVRLNRDHSLSRLPTGFLGVYRDWTKASGFLFLPALHSCVW